MNVDWMHFTPFASLTSEWFTSCATSLLFEEFTG